MKLARSMAVEKEENLHSRSLRTRREKALAISFGGQVKFPKPVNRGPALGFSTPGTAPSHANPP